MISGKHKDRLALHSIITMVVIYTIRCTATSISFMTAVLKAKEVCITLLAKAPAKVSLKNDTD